jgi:sporulation protein YlmC with PRC-barrel domain
MTQKFAITFAAAAFLLSASASSFGQGLVGSTTLGVTVTELRSIATGWSMKHQVLGKLVYNDKNEAIGRIDDVVVAPDKAVSYAIISAGVFLHVVKHDVAIPVSQLQQKNGMFVLPGGTKDALNAMPAFEYAS